jgi:DNA-binding NtrC family response regulator
MTRIPNDDDDRPSAVTLEIAATSRPHEWLVEVQDEEEARQEPLPNAKRMIVGSGRGADVLVRDPTVSARHCALSVLGTGVAIEDLGSRNGTFVGNAKVKEAWGTAGTTLTVGRSTLTCLPMPSDDALAEDEGAPLRNVAGGSRAMRRLASQVRRLARHAAPVLVSGETGTGKELIAKALHDEGPRAAKPFVALNVSALPRDLVESELFGHERGAFTGAVARRIGAFEAAEGGTLFLDEIGELPLEAQPKLLRALDGYEVRSVGAAGGGRRANVRVVAATHVPLEERVVEGQFRRDLFHRLEVFVVDVPPLRARLGDVAAIARAILRQLVPAMGKRDLTPRAIARLTAHDWPGNVRELRNVLYRAGDVTPHSALIDGPDIDRAMRTKHDPDERRRMTPGLARTMLREQGGNLSAAARAARMPRTTFRKLLKG